MQWKNKTVSRLVLTCALAMGAWTVQAADVPQYADLVVDMNSIESVRFDALDVLALGQEDALNDAISGTRKRFAVARDVHLTPANSGEWDRLADGQWRWRLVIGAKEAVHLNLGFSKFVLPEGAELLIVNKLGDSALGPYTSADMLPHGQLWTPVLLGDSLLIQLTVPEAMRDRVGVELSRVGQGYRGFGTISKLCKSGSCNTDVACLAPDDPWNEQRRAVGAITVGGTDTCTGSLVNNTNYDRRMLFATASHCGIASNATAATMLVYWNYESPTCRTPGSSASGVPVTRPNSTTPGLAFIAQTNSPFSGSSAADTRSDWTLLELATPAPDNTFNLYWAGWDRSAPPSTCAAPSDPSGTAGLCASIHHPGVDEKRITFVEEPMIVDNISSATGVHWRANWDPTPPILAGISNPPASLPASVTEPGSSGSPLYNAEHRLVGVLSGGPSSCGATGTSLRDQYGGLFHSWEGLGTPTTRMRDYLDPAGTGAVAIDGMGMCDAPEAPATVTATVAGSNSMSVSWSAVAGINTYRVLRSTGACPGGNYSQIAEVTGVTSYTDDSVSGGTTYSYKIVSIDTEQPCQSAPSTCSSATATGVCSLEPTFAGVQSVGSAGTEICGINVSWSAASGNCGAGSDVRYNVYRSLTAGFTPGAGNRVASCLTDTSLSQGAVDPASTYHYIVRAEDAGALGSGVCGGREDSNAIELSAQPFGPDIITFSDDVESGAANWVSDGTGTNSFAIVTTAANSPVSSWFVADPSSSSDRRLSVLNPVSIPAGSSASLEFYHRFATESGYDGGVLEYSVDGGTTWVDILAGSGSVPANANRFTVGAYVGTLNASAGALGGRAAWFGAGTGGFTRVAVSLADFAGQNVRFRFRFSSDSSVGGTGWWIDDIRIAQSTPCVLVDPGEVFGDGFEGNAPGR